jgi:hypothetical protein
MLKGENGTKAKLTEQQALSILREKPSGITDAALGKKYNVDRKTISSLVTRKTWKHLTI